MRDKAIAFVCGDITVMLFILLNGGIGAFAIKVLATLILGAAGGIAGLAAKDFYNWAWKKYKERKNKSPKTNSDARN